MLIVFKGRLISPSLLPILLVLVLAGCAPAPYDLGHDPTPYEYDQPAPYFLYLPDGYDPARAWPVFVGIHGFGGDGHECLDMWQSAADEAGYVLVCPSLADESGGWYTDLGEKMLLLILKDVENQVNIQPKIFLAGVSAGAEFAQAFAFDFPGRVAGVAVLSSGNYLAPSEKAADIPFLVVIGDRDNAAGLRGAQQFTELLAQKGFRAELHVLPGVGHTFTQDHQDLTLDFYQTVMDK